MCRAWIRRSRSGLARLRRHCAASTSVEFAIVALPCLGLILGLFGISYDFYLQEALDYALQQSVRQIQLGAVPATYSAGDFASNIFCPVFSGFAACSGITISVQPVTDYQNIQAELQAAASAGHSATFCVGQPGQLMYAQVVYLAPLVAAIWPYGTLAAGGSSNVLTSTAAFAVENPAGVTPPATAGC